MGTQIYTHKISTLILLSLERCADFGKVHITKYYFNLSAYKMTYNSTGMTLLSFSYWPSLGLKHFDLFFCGQKFEIKIWDQDLLQRDKHFYCRLKIWFWDVVYLSGKSKTVINTHNKFSDAQDKAGAHFVFWRLCITSLAISREWVMDLKRYFVLIPITS